MSEQQSIRVPIEIPPAQQRRSLHSVRMGQSIASSVAAQAEGPQPPQYAPVEQPTYSQPAQAQENYMENQFNGNQQPPQAPNPMDYDHHDPQDAARWQADSSAYLQSQIDAGVQRALAPSRHAQNEAEMNAQYNSALSKFGDDGNFQATMNRALEMCIADDRAGRPINIEQRYLEASESASRTPGQRTSHLPPQAKTVKGLGQLIDFHHRRGTAKPFNGRNWRG